METVKKIVYNTNISLVVIQVESQIVDPCAISYDQLNNDSIECIKFLKIITDKYNGDAKYVIYTISDGTISVENDSQEIQIFNLIDFSSEEKVDVEDFLTYCKNKF